MARRGINIKAKAKEIQDSLNQVDSSVSKLGKDATSVVTPVNNAASSVDKLSEAVSKFSKKKSSLDVDIKTSKETFVDSIKPLKELNTEVKSVEKSVNDSADASNRIKNAVEKFKKPLQNLDVKVNISNTDIDSVKKLVNKIAEPFNDLEKQIDPASRKAVVLSDAFGRFRQALEDIQSYASDLKTTLDIVMPKNKKTATGFKETVFGSFGKLLDSIHASIDEKKLQKFQTTASSLKTFTNSLKDMITIGKTFNDAQGSVGSFLKTMETPATKDGIDTPVNRIVNIVNSYVDGLSKLVKRDIVKGKDADGVEYVKNKINPYVQGIQDVGNTIGVLAASLTKLATQDVKNGTTALDAANTSLYQFIDQLGSLGEPSKGQISFKDAGNGKIAVVFERELNSKVQGVRDILGTMTVLNNELHKLSEKGESGANAMERVKSVLPNYITGLFDAFKGMDFKDGLANLDIIRSALSKYANVLPKLSLPNNAMVSGGSIEATAQTIYNLFDAFRTMDVQAGLNNMDVISTVLAKYASVLKNLSKIGTINFQQIRVDFEEFVKALNALANSNALKDIPQDSADRFGALGRALKGISSFINSVVKGGDFSGFVTNIEKAIPAITEFINRMAGLTTLSAFPDFERVARAVGSFNGRLKEVNSTAEHSSRSFIRLRSILRQIYTAFVGGAVIYSIVRSIKSAVKEMFNLEYAMAHVNTIARVSSGELKNMTHYVQEMSSTYGIASSKVTKALYDINSATIKGSASLKILEQSAKLAVAGFTDIEKVTDLIAKAVNAYEYSASEAAKISDILFVTVERGINPMEELSEYMGRLFTVAANAGVSLEEVGAGLATLTARGYQTNVASTALNSAILKLSTGTKELNKLFNQYGYASSASALRTLGLSGAIEILYKATNGATEKLHDLGFNYRDIRAATTLASGAISEYNKTLALMNDETYKNGLTNEALAKVQDTVIFKFNQLKETYTVFIQSISEYLNRNQDIKTFLDALSGAISTLTKSMQGFSLSTKEQAQAGLVTLIPKLLLVYAVFKPISKAIGGLVLGAHVLGDSIKGLHTPISDLNKEVVISSKVASSAKYSFDNMSRGFSNVTTPVIKTTHAFKNLANELSIVPQVASKTNVALNGLSKISAGTVVSRIPTPLENVLLSNNKNFKKNPTAPLFAAYTKTIDSTKELSSFYLKNGLQQGIGNENVFGYDSESMYSKGIALSNDKLIKQFSSMKHVIGETSTKVQELGKQLSILPKATSGLVLSGTGMKDFPVGSLNMTQPLASLGPSDTLKGTVNIASAFTPIKAFAETAQISIKGVEETVDDVAKKLTGTLSSVDGNVKFQTKSLLNVLSKGVAGGAFYVTPNKFGNMEMSNVLNAAGFGFGTASSGKEDLATVVSNYGKTLKEGIGSVFLHGAVADSYLPILREKFPNVRFENIADQQRVLQEMADSAKKVTGGLNSFAYGIKDVSNKTNAISIGLNGFRRNLEGSSLSNIGLNTTAISKINDQFNIHPAMYTGKLDTTISSTSGILGALQKDLPNLAVLKNKVGGFGNYSFNPYTQMPFDSIRSKLNTYDMAMYSGKKGFSAIANPSQFIGKAVHQLTPADLGFNVRSNMSLDQYSILKEQRDMAYNVHSGQRIFDDKALASELKYVENAAKKTQISFNGMTKSIENLTVKGDKLTNTTGVIKTQFNNIEEAAKKTGYSVNNVASGLVLSGESAEKVTKELTKAQIAMKAFGNTLKTSITQFAMMYVQMAMVQGVVSLLGDIAKLKSAGFGFADTMQLFFDDFWKGLAGIGGKFIDILSFGITNFSEKWSAQPDYVDEEALRESRMHVGDENKSGFGQAVSAQISTLKKFDALANGLDEDKILKAYNSAIDEIQKEARSRKVSKDQLEVALKVASEQRDLLLSYNDTIKKLLPNTQALSDVFKQASKNIEESVDKFASPMEKQIREMVEAQNAITKIAKITGWSEEQIKSGGVSVSGFNLLEEMWKEQQGRSQIELANLIAPSIGSVLNPSSYTKMRTNAEKDAFSKYSEFATLMKNKTGLDIGYNYKGAISKYSDEMLGTVRHFMENPEYSNDESISKSAREFSLAWNELNKIKKMPDFEKYSMGIDTFISDISRLFTPEQLSLIEQHKEDLLNAFVKIPDKDKNDPDIISKKLMDIIADPELAKQLDVLGKTYLSSIHNAEQFRKSISKVGLDLSKLGTELSPEGIIGNKFNLQSVREIKERLKNTVYDPKTILGADLGVVDQYANIAMKGILGHNPVNVIVDSLVTEFKKNDALKDLDTNELQNRAISFIGAIQQIGSYTKDFVKQLSEMDYTKAMNKMRFGSELSAFKKFRLFGKDMISSLLGMDITGAGGATFGELLREFEADTKASGFDTARDNMIKKFGDAGETVWSAFAELFKDLIGYENEFINPLNTEFRNLKKRGKDFVKNYKDSMLSPIEQFDKTQALLNRQLARISRQAKRGELKSESIKNAMDTIDKLYKLNEETMNIKVPAAITASEAVRTGSKEAFDLVARNVFKDTYKVNVRQEKLQEKLVKASERLVQLAVQGSKDVSESITLP